MERNVLDERERELLARIQHCNIHSHQRITTIFGVLGVIWGMLLILAGIAVNYSALLFAGGGVLVIVPVIAAGRRHILLCYELVQKLGKEGAPQ